MYAVATACILGGYMADGLLDVYEQLEAEAANEHDRHYRHNQAQLNRVRVSDTRAVSQVTMTKDEKERLTRICKAHGLSFSAFVRLACNEYIDEHGWE